MANKMAQKKVNSFEFPKPIETDFLIGHSNILKTFETAWNNKNHNMHPVWILSGPKGIGKATMAYQIAKQVYGNIGDFFIIDIEHNIDKDKRLKPDGKVISVYTVREMIERMQMSSMSGGWRVIIIDSVDELNTSASNAILKLLEEPPAKTLFLLIVHSLANVLPTIRSRARVEKMTPLTISQLRELCVKFIPTDDISTDTLKLANGSFGKIADLKQNGGDIIYTQLLDILKDPNTNAADMINIAKKIAPAAELHGILLDAIAHFGLADLYPTAMQEISTINRVHLEPEIGLFKIINDIKKSISKCS
jgi:DNA polymerase-3 subunit delta'